MTDSPKTQQASCAATAASTTPPNTSSSSSLALPPASSVQTKVQVKVCQNRWKKLLKLNKNNCKAKKLHNFY